MKCEMLRAFLQSGESDLYDFYLLTVDRGPEIFMLPACNFLASVSCGAGASSLAPWLAAALEGNSTNT